MLTLVLLKILEDGKVPKQAFSETKLEDDYVIELKPRANQPHESTRSYETCRWLWNMVLWFMS